MNEELEKPTCRNIPLPIQREVRQRCGFGCVICGTLLYEYDHILTSAQGIAIVRKIIRKQNNLNKSV